MSTTLLVLALVLCGAAFVGGFAVGRLTASRRGALSADKPPVGPPHKDLWWAQPVWFPWKGEWKRGRISGPADPARHFYLVRAYDTNVPANREIRVAHPDLRLDDDRPLTEMCPPMSIVELEEEMKRDARRLS